MYSTLSELTNSLQYTLTHSPDGVSIIDATALKDKAIDMLIMSAFFSQNEAVRIQSRNIIREAAAASGTYPTSILPLYQAIGQGKVSGFTVPALNVRTLTYDFARTVFRLANEKNIGPVIFEIARSEMEYTDQSHDDFALSILAGAIKEGYKGPVFLQGDHYQIRKKHFIEHRDEELQDIKTLIDNALEAQFYNIDIDASTLVDLSQPDLKRQQELNSDITAVFTAYIRNKQPRGVTVSIGGEIGHIGDRNSTVEDFQAFMDLYLPQVRGQQGISKVSVQTGTSHGGTILPDGSMQEVVLDFAVLKAISEIARTRYGMGGAVQHGASTLPEGLFSEFPKTQTLEIHLSTGFQNTVFDHLPEGLKKEMLAWVSENCKSDMKPEWNEQQFLYKARKKSLGPFKRQLWEMREEEKQPIVQAFEKQLTTIFTNLSVLNTKDTLLTYFPEKTTT